MHRGGLIRIGHECALQEYMQHGHGNAKPKGESKEKKKTRSMMNKRHAQIAGIDETFS